MHRLGGWEYRAELLARLGNHLLGKDCLYSTTLEFVSRSGISAMKKLFLTVIAVCCGAAITYVDSRPNWDDTGITAIAILVTSGVISFLSPNRWWLWAITIGIWIPLLAIIRAQNFAAILALVVAFFGAVLGMLIRNRISVIRTTSS